MELALIVTTSVSVVLAATMGIIAWRLARRPNACGRRRGLRRLRPTFATLEGFRDQAAAGFGGESARFRQAARRSIDFDRRARAHSRRLPASCFRPGADRSRSSLAAVLAVGGFAVAASLALVIVTSRGGSSLGGAGGQSGDHNGAGGELSHRWSWWRSVTNATTIASRFAGSCETLLEAQTSTSSRRSPTCSIARVGLLGNGGSAIDLPALGPGAESAFAVIVGHAATVGRYRVSFKTGNRVVPHVDRRNLGAVQRTDR